jgi:hypothetical protein
MVFGSTVADCLAVSYMSCTAVSCTATDRKVTFIADVHIEIPIQISADFQESSNEAIVQTLESRRT